MKNEVKLIQEQLDKLTRIKKNRYGGYRDTAVEGWISGTISVLERIFGKESIKIQEVRRIEENEVSVLTGDNYYETNVMNEIAESILQSCIDELKTLSSPATIYDGKNNSINLTMTQNQSNTQTVDIKVIFDALNDELSGTQLKEIQSIIDSEESKKSKRDKLFNKLKDFGVDAVSSIVSGILMNIIQGK